MQYITVQYNTVPRQEEPPAHRHQARGVRLRVNRGEAAAQDARNQSVPVAGVLQPPRQLLTGEIPVNFL